MIPMITKRDGSLAPFSKDRIIKAVNAAKLDSKEEYLNLEELVATEVRLATRNMSEVSIQEITELVESSLMHHAPKVARAYIEFRHDRDEDREARSEWARLGIDITSGEDSESQRENSNVPRGSVTTQVEMIKRLYAKKFANDFILPKKFSKPHNDGDIHIHDSDAIITKIPNCCLMHYPFMLEHGFQLGNKWIETPNTILTTMNVLVQMVQVQSNLQFGGLTLADIDVYLGKYILGSFKKYLEDAVEDLEGDTQNLKSMLRYIALSKEVHPENVELLAVYPKEVKIAIKRTEREVYRAAKLLSYQLNTLQVRGESSPFVTITYGSATTWEGRLLQKCILQERLDEFDKSGVQEFPKHMMLVTPEVNLDTNSPNHDLLLLAIKTSAKTCYPDYIFPDNQEKHTGGSASYMGCRSLLSPWYNEQGEKQYMGRANIGVCSVNLPRIAMESEGDFEVFFKTLEARLDLAAGVVKWRYDRLITLKAKEAAFTYIGGVFGMHLDPEDTIEKVFANGRGSLSIGYIGIYETVLYMIGKDPILDTNAFNFQVQLLDFINEKVDSYAKTTGLGYGLYGTPSESLTDRFCSLDVKRFGKIKGVTDKGFYVNSFHVNTEAQVTAFEKMAFEAEFQKRSKGGHVGFVEMNNLSGNLPAYLTLINYAYSVGLMYIGVNSPWDFCKSCHWTGDLLLNKDVNQEYVCPCCGETNNDNLVKTIRLCGYLATGNKRPPVAGRILEILSRVKHG